MNGQPTRTRSGKSRQIGPATGVPSWVPAGAFVVVGPGLVGLSPPSAQIAGIAVGLLLTLALIGGLVCAIPSVKAKAAAGRDRASGWIEGAITAWEREGRISSAEAARLRTEIASPGFQAVLPHFGVHLAIGVVLRFPFGSIARVSYLLANIAVNTGRLLARRIDHGMWRRMMGIHSPLVLLLACLPGVGTFAYLASKPFRSNHLLLRLALDAVLLKFPWRVYQRTGIRWLIARPLPCGPAIGGGAAPARRIAVLQVAGGAQPIVALLALIAVLLFAVDVAAQTANRVLAPDIVGWPQVMRMLDLDSESSFATWFTILLLVLCSALLAIIAQAARSARNRFARHWFVLALLTLGVSIDEQVRLHDPGGGIGARAREWFGFLTGPLYYGWVMVALVSVLIVGLYYRRFLGALPAATRTLFVAAAAFYVGGEVGTEMINGILIEGGERGLLYETMTSVEEFAGLIGIVIAIAALLLYIERFFGEVDIRLAGDQIAGHEPAPVLPRPRTLSPGAVPAMSGLSRPSAAAVQTRQDRAAAITAEIARQRQRLDALASRTTDAGDGEFFAAMLGQVKDIESLIDRLTREQADLAAMLADRLRSEEADEIETFAAEARAGLALATPQGWRRL